jgi:hypothetical protein
MRPPGVNVRVLSFQLPAVNTSSHDASSMRKNALREYAIASGIFAAFALQLLVPVLVVTTTLRAPFDAVGILVCA